MNVEQVMAGTSERPEMLDSIEFEFQGVTVRAFGILHGVTGGLNREYSDFVKASIRKVSGLKLAEKGMKQLYRGCGIDAELEDWLVLRPIDCIVMGFQLVFDPRCFWMITMGALGERLRNKAPALEGSKDTRALGASPFFHCLDAFERRDLIGFLPSETAIQNDLRSMSRWFRAIIPRKRHVRIEDPHWRRILLLERVMHIPCRSIHMLHYAASYARAHDETLVNVFVGETHNTDMAYLATRDRGYSYAASLNTRYQKIISRASSSAAIWSPVRRMFLCVRKALYVVFLFLGAATALCLYAWLVLELILLWGVVSVG